MITPKEYRERMSISKMAAAIEYYVHYSTWERWERRGSFPKNEGHLAAFRIQEVFKNESQL